MNPTNTVPSWKERQRALSKPMPTQLNLKAKDYVFDSRGAIRRKHPKLYSSKQDRRRVIQERRLDKIQPEPFEPDETTETVIKEGK